MIRADYSLTAAYIAIKFYGLTRNAAFRRLFSQDILEYYEKLIPSFHPPLHRWARWLQKPLLRRAGILAEQTMLPGDLLHIVARKWYTHKLMAKARQDGYQQLVVLGSGFDHTAWHAASNGWAPVVELDSPPTADFKNGYFKQLGPLPSSFKIFPIDLSHHRPENELEPLQVMKPNRPTLVLAEGFFDYLNRPLTRRLMETLRRQLYGPVRLMTTVFDLEALPWFRRWVFEYSIRTVGEELLLHLNAAEFRRLLEEEQFEICHWLDFHFMENELQQITGTQLPILRGFHLVTADYNG